MYIQDSDFTFYYVIFVVTVFSISNKVGLLHGATTDSEWLTLVEDQTDAVSNATRYFFPLMRIPIKRNNLVSM